MWFLEMPSAFASPPQRMSASTLGEIESCPRRYALRRATYSKIWDGYGYPPKPTLKNLEGLIIHSSLEQIVKALSKVGCSSDDDALFMQTMRSIGGYSGVLRSQLATVSEVLAKNPRVDQKASQLTEKINDSLPRLRQQLQGQVAQLEFDNKESTNSGGNDNLPRLLSNGTHSEVELYATELKWYGKIDYLYLSSNKCEIADFKMGERKPEHVFQIRIYNMLWMLDSVRNPNFIPVTRLSLRYKNGNVEVPPLNETELNDFVENLKQRTQIAIAQVMQPVPIAIPSVENCSFCPVRQLCSVYWTTDIQKQLGADAAATGETKFRFDIEVKLENRLSEYIWYAEALVSSTVASQTRLIVRFAPSNSNITAALESGLRVRLLDVNLGDSVDEEVAVQAVSSNWQSEAFLIT